MFPLITNGRDLSLRRVFEAYKLQPKLEKRHEQLKSVQDLAPVWLKSVSRIEALRGMVRDKIESFPLYPEERECRAPSTERILDLFVTLQRHRLRRVAAAAQRSPAARPHRPGFGRGPIS